MDMRQQSSVTDQENPTTPSNIDQMCSTQSQNVRTVGKHVSQYQYELVASLQQRRLNETSTVGEHSVGAQIKRPNQHEPLREDHKAFALQQYEESFSPWRQSAPSQTRVYCPPAGDSQQVSGLHLHQQEYYAREASQRSEVSDQVKQEQPLETLAQDARDLVHHNNPAGGNQKTSQSASLDHFIGTDNSDGKILKQSEAELLKKEDAIIQVLTTEQGLKTEILNLTEEGYGSDKIKSKVEGDTNTSDGKLRKVEFLALSKEVKEHAGVKSRVVGIIGEDVLQLFNSAVDELNKDSNEVIDNKNLAFLFYAIRNSTILELGEEKNELEPLSNLALSVPLLSNLLTFLEKNSKLKDSLILKVKEEDFNYYQRVIKECTLNTEDFLLDSATAPRIVFLYHTIRNNVLADMFSQLSSLLDKLQDIIINTENSVDNSYNISVTQMKSLLGLPWNQQVIAVEAMNFDLSFLNNFQTFWLLTIVQQTKKICQKDQSSKRGKGKKSKKRKNIEENQKVEMKVPTLKMKLRDNNYPTIYKEEEDELLFTEDDVVKMEPMDDNSEDMEADEEDEEEGSDSQNGHPSVTDFLEFNINFEKEKEVLEEDQDEILDEETGHKSVTSEEMLEIKKETEEQENFYQQTKKTFKEGDKSFKYVQDNHCHICHQNFTSASDWRTHMFAHAEARPFECHIVGCDKAFSRKDVLKGHIKSHSKDRPFVCNFPGCEKTFTRNWYMKVHYETSHMGQKKEEVPVKKVDKILFCELCEETREKTVDMKSHLKEEHPEFDYIAGFSGFTIKYRNENGDFIEKAAALEGSRIHTCNYCDHLSNKISNIKQHLKGVHKNIKLKFGDTGFTTTIKDSTGEKSSQDNKTHECVECDFQSASSTALQKHINTIHDGGQAIQCAECEYETKSKKEFTIHMKDIHTPRVFMCDQCDYTAAKEEYLKKHIKFNHEGFRYKCDQCDFASKCPASLSDHSNSAHKGIFYQCDQCDYKCGYRSNFKKHYLAEHEMVRYPCDQCEYQAKDKSSLKQHIQCVHLKEFENFECDFADCSFKAEKNAFVYRHKMAVHELASYECTHCQFNTTERETIFEHMKTKHEFTLDDLGGYYFCGLCDFRTKTRGSLNRHKNCLHSDLSYACKYCGYTTSDPYTVRRHNKTQHGVVLDIKDIQPIPADQQKPVQKRGYTWSREKSHPMLREPAETKKSKYESQTSAEMGPGIRSEDHQPGSSNFPEYFMPQNARNVSL